MAALELYLFNMPFELVVCSLTFSLRSVGSFARFLLRSADMDGRVKKSMVANHRYSHVLTDCYARQH